MKYDGDDEKSKEETFDRIYQHFVEEGYTVEDSVRILSSMILNILVHHGTPQTEFQCLLDKLGEIYAFRLHERAK